MSFAEDGNPCGNLLIPTGDKNGFQSRQKATRALMGREICCVIVICLVASSGQKQRLVERSLVLLIDGGATSGPRFESA